MEHKRGKPTLYIMIKRIARRLSTPAKAGVYISIPDLTKIADTLDIPLTIRRDRRWVI